MSDRGRVVLIFVIVGLLAGGGGYYFFKVYSPAQDLKNAQAEIAGWEQRFQLVRDCLLGAEPRSSKTSEALAIREMAPDPWDRGRCTPLIAKLNRGEAPDTGIPAVEQAWTALEKSSSKAALAFAKHVSESTTLREDPLPAALDELDAARRALRTAARMPIAETGGATLPAATLVPIADAEDGLTRLYVDTIPSAHGMVLFGETKSRSVQVTLTAGGAPEVRRVGGGAIRAVPDMSWGATATPTEVRVGAFDGEGAQATPTTLALPAPTVAAVSGTLDAGVLVYGNLSELVVAKAANGTVTPGAPKKISVAQAGIDVDGRVALIWGDATATRGLILTPGADDPPSIELPAPVGQLCLTADRAWTQATGTAVSFGGGRPTFTTALRGHLQGCTPDAALYRANTGRDSFEICGNECRAAVRPSGAPEDATTTVVGGKLVAIASHAGVLGVWHEGAEPTFYALPEQAKPVLAHEWPAMALTDGKVIDVLARSASGFVIIRIPAV